MIKSLLHEIKRTVLLPVRKKKLKRLEDQGFPPELIPSVNFILTRKADYDLRRISCAVEQSRDEIAAGGNQSVEILYSPKPGSSGNVKYALSELRPHHGKPMQFTMEQVARTGKDKIWGSALYLIARESGASVILELGSCAGISGSYLASSPHCKTFHTIEGSAALASLAQESIGKVTQNAQVHNALFDDALDELLPKLDRIDLAFIDGHHEKVATIHYWQRIAPKMRPGGIVIFDDISWSLDMRECWDYLVKQPGFKHTVDFGSIGVCIVDGEESGYVQNWDLQPVLGRKRIGTPHGWRR